MAIWNLGSINTDFVYHISHIPQKGETLAATKRQIFLGGKGANMSVAAARAAAHVYHIGAIGKDSQWTLERLLEYGVDTRNITILGNDPAEAVIMVDPSGENAIILHPGANVHIPHTTLQTALAAAETGDWLIVQNETNLQRTAAEMGKRLGLHVAYAAAPFDVARVAAVLPYLDLLILNAVEADQFEKATGQQPETLTVPHVVVTRGADGVDLYFRNQKHHFPAIKVDAVDTTGAGDTFTGYVIAGLDRKMPMAQAITQAVKASALMVTRHGTADVIPDLSEVRAFTA